MRLTESMMRKIIREEAEKALEGEYRPPANPFGVEMGSDRDDDYYGDEGDDGDDDGYGVPRGMTFVDTDGTPIDGEEMAGYLHKDLGFSSEDVETIMKLMLLRDIPLGCAKIKSSDAIGDYVDEMIRRAIQ